MKFQFSRQIFEKYSNIKFHENSSSGSRSVPRGRPDRRTDITKLGVDFRNFTKAPIISSARKKEYLVRCERSSVFRFVASNARSNEIIWRPSAILGRDDRGLFNCTYWRTLQRSPDRITGLFVDSDLEQTCKDDSMAWFHIVFGNCLEGIRGITEDP